jgi:SAM-dependent methyltransferase
MADEQVTELTNWNERYATAEYIYGTAPNQYLRSQLYRLAPGARVLVAADGEGRNGVWLAACGLDVTCIDQSPVGLAKAAALARQRGVAPRFVCADLAAAPIAGAPYQAVVAVFAHFPPDTRAHIHRSLAATLQPGGLFVLEAFHPRQLGRPSGGPRSVDMLYSADLLCQDFAGLEVLELVEGVALLDEGPKHQGEGFIVRFVGRKPKADRPSTV